MATLKTRGKCMKSRFFKIVTPLLMLSIFLFGITPAFSSRPPAYSADELTNRLKTGAYLQKTDNLLIIVDGQGQSRWMTSRSTSKLSKGLLQHIGETIPKIPHRRMLRVFGPDAESYQKDFSTIFGLFHIDAKGFTPIIATKTHAISDFDPLGMTFISATKDLRKLSGTHAVVLISDGINIPKSAIYESAYMKKKFRGSVCYYPIIIGNDPQGAKNMSTIAKIGGCGFLAQYEAVDSPAELTDYVEKIFFAKRRVPVKAAAPVVVPEPEEKPTMEEPVAPVMTDTSEITEIVEEPAIPEVIEDQYAEKMPVVDDSIIILERQLPHDKVVTIELHVEFDLNKSSLRSGYEQEIKKVADFMALYPETEALLEGHTCDLGSEAYNQQLSSRRANTVKNYLVKNFGIDPERLKTRGAGESEPIAENTTEQGRMKNRRVMAVISTIVTDYVVVEQEILKSEFLSDDFVLPPVDQIVEEMMQEEVVDKPLGGEITEEGSESAPVVPESDSLPPVDTPEMTSAPDENAKVSTPVEVQEEAAEDTGMAVQEGTVDKQAVQPESAPSQAIVPADGESPAPIVPSSEPPVSEEVVSQPTASEDVVVVSPGESAFDDKGAPGEVEMTEEVTTESITPAEEAVEGSETEEKESQKRLMQEEDSYL